MTEFTAKSDSGWNLRVRVVGQRVLIYVEATYPYPGSDYQYGMTMTLAEWRRLATRVEYELAEQALEEGR